MNQHITRHSTEKRNITMTWWMTAGVLIFGAFFIMLCIFKLAPFDFMQNLRVLRAQPKLIVLNYAPVLLITGFFYFLAGNAFYALSACTVVNGVLALINRFKIIYRDDPLVPQDIGLLREAMNTVTNFKVELEAAPIIFVLAVALLLAIAGVFIKSYRVKLIALRIPLALFCAGFLVILSLTVYANEVRYENFKKTHPYNVTWNFNELGFNYCFIRNFTAYGVYKPEGYDEDQVKAWSERQGDISSPEVKPHIMFVMIEAFSDISDYDAFAYSAENDPMKRFKEIAESDRAINGHVVVPNYGGGTANTEFDVMTGMQSNMINTSPTSAFRIVRKNTASIPRAADVFGYDKFFIHPGDSWFYNRVNVYPFLGIDHTIFRNDFTEPEIRAGQISDRSFYEKIIKTFEEKAKSGKPVISNNVSIQNHLPYSYEKYDGVEIEQVLLRDEYRDVPTEALSCYIQGIRDADSMMKSLTDYFENLDEPVIAVFFGDHLPSFGGNYAIYRELDIPIGDEADLRQNIRSASTPFLIWINEAYSRSIDYEEVIDELGLADDIIINANYLGAMVMEIAGLTGADPFIDYVNGLRRKLPVFRNGIYVNNEGEYTDILPMDLEESLSKFHQWQYYRLRRELLS